MISVQRQTPPYPEEKNTKKKHILEGRVHKKSKLSQTQPPAKGGA